VGFLAKKKAGKVLKISGMDLGEKMKLTKKSNWENGGLNGSHAFLKSKKPTTKRRGDMGGKKKERTEGRPHFSSQGGKEFGTLITWTEGRGIQKKRVGL